MRTAKTLIHVAATTGIAVLVVLGLHAGPSVASKAVPQLGSATTAQLPTWEVLKTQYLTNSPAEGMPTDCVSGRWELGSGLYTWGHELGIVGHSYTSIDPLWWNLQLGAGAYTMRTCLDPRDGYYTQRTSLNPDNPAWATINIEGWWDPLHSETYSWGAYLQPDF